MSRYAPARALRRRSLRGASLLALLIAGPACLLAPAAHAEEAEEAGTVEALTVVGQRLGSAKAIEAQKQAEVVAAVISADDLGKLPDANVADALARVPGVNVVVNQETGEGEYVTVRGFAGTFNAYSINGVRVALTDPESRKMSMTLLPPNGLQAITVSKTLTPDMDGDAVGGSIDFRTPTAFDFRKPVVRLFGTYGINDRAREQGEDSGNMQIQADFATRFGDLQQFGIFASVNYGKAHTLNEETENDGEWEPYRWRKNSTEAIDERSMYLPGIDLDYRRVEQERYGANFSFDYRGEAHDLYFRGQYNRFERVSNNDYTDFRSRSTVRLVQANENDVNLTQPENNIIGTGAKGRIYGYTTAQIVDQDKDGVITDADRKTKSYWSLFGRSGVWSPQAFQMARTFEVQDQNQTLATVNVGGRSRLDRLTLDYDLSYSWGDKESPGGYSVGYNCDVCSAPFNQTGLLWSSYDPRFPLPQLPAFAKNGDRDDSLLPFDGAGLSRNKQTDKRIAVRLDARYDMDGGVIDFLKGGLKISRAEREYDNTPMWSGDFSGTPLDGKNLAQSGLVDRHINSMLGGRYYYGAILNRERVIAAIEAARKANPVTYTTADLNADDKKGEETVIAAYGLANLKFDALEVIAGLRAERTKVDNTFWVNDGANSRFGSSSKEYTNVLPSVTAIYRPSEQFVYRAALWTSFSRPEFVNIMGGQSITRDPATKEITAIHQGNPDLKPAQAINFDVSAEYYPDATSVVSIGGFYKKIDNFIFTNNNQVDATTKSGVIDITQPKNGETAKIYGVELNLVKSFDGLMEPFDGFGVEGNVTWQKSEAESGLDYRKGRKTSFVGAPDLLYNASLTFQKWGFEAKLSYNYQGAYVEDLRDNAVDKWVQPNKSLDFHSRYTFHPGMSVDFDVQNILDGHRYYTTKGENPTYMKDYMEPGRTFLVRFSYVR